MSGPEGLGTTDTPLPLALGGVWWCSTPVWESETRVTALPEDLAASRALISSVFLSYRTDSAAPPDNRRGGAVSLTIIRQKVLRQYLRRGKP
eukprot:4600645-Pleurochrysis_carterae.AAC.1